MVVIYVTLMAPLIPFTSGVELEFLFAVNTDVVAQDPTYFLSPHTGLESSLVSKTFCKTAVSPRPPLLVDVSYLVCTVFMA